MPTPVSALLHAATMVTKTTFSSSSVAGNSNDKAMTPPRSDHDKNTPQGEPDGLDGS